MARKRVRVSDDDTIPLNALPDTVVKSAGRVIQIFELFDNAKRPLLAVEVMEALGMPQSSASILLQSLVTMGYLYFDAQLRRFGPTARVALLGNWVGNDLFRDGRVTRMMREIADSTGESVALATRYNTSLRYLHVVSACDPNRLRLTVGALLPIAATGTGYALLSTLEDNEIRKIVLRINAYERPPTDPIKLKHLMGRVGIIREQGYGYEEGLYNPHGAVVAMPLPFTDGGLPLTITVDGTIEGMRPRQSHILSVLRMTLSKYLCSEN